MIGLSVRRYVVALVSLLVLGQITVTSASLEAVNSNTTSGDLLLLFKASIKNWNKTAATFQGWTNDTKAVCTWTGVACNSNNDITKLDLSRAGFVSPLPTQLAFLTKLVTLNLSFNSFSGALPASWGDQSFGNLQTLDLTSNRLTQTLPAAWGRTDGFPNLTSLQLRNNQISGSLPSTWANARGLSRLRLMDLSTNSLSGPLSGSWGGNGAFPSLTVLNLANNSISGSLPRLWGATSFASLEQLILTENSLTGTLPGSWAVNGSWPKLTQLQLNANQLEGVIPPSWFKAPAFPKLLAVTVQPGNSGLCGVLPAVTSFALLSKPALGASTALTGTLGACTSACGNFKTSGNTTNLFGISVETGVALRDLLALNPGIDTSKPVFSGTSLVRPCYSQGQPKYLGANIAFQQATSQSSTVLGRVASAPVAFSVANSSDGRQCSQTQDGTQANPAWWRVDLGVATDIAGLVLASNTAMTGLKILVGDNKTPLGNQECAVGIENAANVTFSQICPGMGQYITITRVSGAAISLCGVEVFPVAANAAISKQITTSSGGGLSAVDGLTSSCAAATTGGPGGSAWLTVDLGYSSQLAAVGLDLGSSDLTTLSLRVGDIQPASGNENEACQPAISNLPGYSKTLFTCSLTGRYVTAVAGSAAGKLEVCLISVFVQEAPTQALAIGPSSDLIVSLSPAAATAFGPGLLSAARAPAPMIYAPGDIVDLGFRLVLIGQNVVEFDGKEVAVVNALKATLAPVQPISIQITSYTVGAPVPNAPAPSIGRRLTSASGAVGISEGDIRESLPFPPAILLLRKLQQQVTEGAVIINVVVRSVAQKQEETTLLLQNSVASGNFTKALNDAGLQASATRYSAVPLNAAVSPAPASTNAVSAVGTAIDRPSLTPGNSSTTRNGGGSNSNKAAAIGGAVGGALLLLLLVAALLCFVWSCRRRRRQRQTSALVVTKADVESASSSSDSMRASRKPPLEWPLHWTGPQSTKFVESSNGGRMIYAHSNGNGNDGGSAASLHDGSVSGDPPYPGGRQLLLPAAKYARYSPTHQLSAPSGWETPLGLGPGDPEGSSGAFMSPRQQVAMGQMGSLGALRMTALDTLDTTMSEIDGQPHMLQGVEPAAAEDPAPQRWTSTSAELWPITYQELTFLKQIGEGSFGRVYMARWRETTVAVKVLHRQTGDHQDEDLPLDPCPSAGSPDPILCALQKEAGIMASVRHPNVISYLGVCAEPACIVTEYCSKGSLTDVLRRGRISTSHAAALDWSRRLNMAMDAAKGMLHLHLCDPPIIHRDLKSPNLLVDKHWRLKVCDFNLSRVMEESVVLSSMVASNPRWLAPEILAGLPYTVAADVYSFGIIMWELLTWEVPWSQQNTWQVHAMVTVEHMRPDLPVDVATTSGGTFGDMKDYLALMSDCWSQDADDRPDFESVIGRLRRMLAVESIGSRHAAESTPGNRSPTHPSSSGTSAATASAPRLGGSGVLMSI